MTAPILSPDGAAEAWRELLHASGYQLGSLLARGHGYELLDAQLMPEGERVALKVFTGSDALYRRRQLLRELERRASLEHPNLLTVRAVGEAAGQPYVAFEFCDAPTLADRVGAGPVRPEDCLRVLSGVASAVDAAAATGTITRDLTPDAVLDHPVRGGLLADLGAAREVLGRVPVALDEHVAYRSPEERRRKSLAATAAVYSLGAVLYTALTAEPPHPASRLRAGPHLTLPPPKVWRYGRHLPRELDAVIARAMAPQAGARYSTAGELMRAAAEVLRATRFESRALRPHPQRSTHAPDQRSGHHAVAETLTPKPRETTPKPAAATSKPRTTTTKARTAEPAPRPPGAKPRRAPPKPPATTAKADTAEQKSPSATPKPRRTRAKTGTAERKSRAPKAKPRTAPAEARTAKSRASASAPKRAATPKQRARARKADARPKKPGAAPPTRRTGAAKRRARAAPKPQAPSAGRAKADTSSGARAKRGGIAASRVKRPGIAAPRVKRPGIAAPRVKRPGIAAPRVKRPTVGATQLKRRAAAAAVYLKNADLPSKLQPGRVTAALPRISRERLDAAKAATLKAPRQLVAWAPRPSAAGPRWTPPSLPAASSAMPVLVVLLAIAASVALGALMADFSDTADRQVIRAPAAGTAAGPGTTRDRRAAEAASERLAETMARLRRERAAALDRLQSAALPSGQALASRSLERSYRTAARTTAGSIAVAPDLEPLRDALRLSAEAYAALAGAAANENRTRYASARAAVGRSEEAVRRALDGLN